MFAHTLGDQELGVLRPAIGALGEPDLLLAQWFAVGCGGIDLVRRAIADVAIQNDERRAALGATEYRERVLDPRQIVGIADPQHVPSVGKEAPRDILGKSNARASLDADVVVVVDPAQVVEAEMARERGGLRADPFHQTAVAANRIDVVVEELEAGAVVAVSKPFTRDRHPDAGGDALAQWAGGRLDSRNPAILRMARRFAAELAETAISSSVTDGLPRRSYSAFTARVPVRYSTDHNSIEAWPFDRIKRSRFGQIGSFGSKHMARFQSA